MRTLLFFLLAFAVPAMAQPSPPYKHFSDADLEAIFGYVLTLPPPTNPAPEPSARD